MRIAHVTAGLCRRSAGLGAAVAGMSAATMRAGNDVRVFGLASADWSGGDGANWSGAPATVFDTAGWSGPLGYAAGMLPAIMDFAPDVLHVHGLWTYPSIAAYKWHRKTGRPLVASAHGMLTAAALKYSRGRKRVAYHLFQERALHAASVLHATSVEEERSYRDLGCRGRIELIPLGVDLSPVPTAGRWRSDRRLLFLGRLHHKKGIDWLAEAWTRIERQFPEWELSVVGPLERSYATDIARFKQTLEGKRVSFVGPLYGDDKNRYIAGSDLLVMPSRSENFGLTAAEALMMEVPVIATMGTPWSGLVTADAGWWIEQGSDALESALRQAMRLDRNALRAKGKNGRRWIENDYSWSMIGARWQRVYESLLVPTSCSGDPLTHPTSCTKPI